MCAQKEESTRRLVVEEILVDTRSRESVSHSFQRVALFRFVQNLELLHCRNMGALKSHAKCRRIYDPTLEYVLCFVGITIEILPALQQIYALGFTILPQVCGRKRRCLLNPFVGCLTCSIF